MINKCKPLSAQTLILRHQNCFLWSNATSSVKLFSRIPLTLPVFPDCWLRIKRKWKKSAMLDRVRRQRTLVLPVCAGSSRLDLHQQNHSRGTWLWSEQEEEGGKKRPAFFFFLPPSIFYKKSRILFKVKQTDVDVRSSGRRRSENDDMFSATEQRWWKEWRQQGQDEKVGGSSPVNHQTWHH